MPSRRVRMTIPWRSPILSQIIVQYMLCAICTTRQDAHTAWIFVAFVRRWCQLSNRLSSRMLRTQAWIAIAAEVCCSASSFLDCCDSSRFCANLAATRWQPSIFWTLEAKSWTDAVLPASEDLALAAKFLRPGVALLPAGAILPPPAAVALLPAGVALLPAGVPLLPGVALLGGAFWTPGLAAIGCGGNLCTGETLTLTDLPGVALRWTEPVKGVLTLLPAGVTLRETLFDALKCSTGWVGPLGCACSAPSFCVCRLASAWQSW